MINNIEQGKCSKTRSKAPCRNETMNQQNEELADEIRDLYKKIKAGKLPDDLDEHDKHLLGKVLPDVMNQISKNSIQTDLARIMKLAGVNYRLNKSSFNLKVREMKNGDELGPFDER